MLSTRALRFNTSAASSGLDHTFASAVASPATVVCSFDLYFATLPNGTCPILYVLNGAAGLGGLEFENSDSKLYARALTTGIGATGATVTTGQWYHIDIKVVSGTTATCDVSVDGTAIAQHTAASSAQTATGIRIGMISSRTGDFYIDNLVVSGTSGDYPIGLGNLVSGLYPNGDGTHAASVNTDFGKGSGGGTDVASSDTDAWQSLANPLSTSVATNFLADKTGATDLSEYLTHTYDNLPVSAGDIHGAMFVATTHSASATSNNFTLRLAATSIMSFDASESTITVPCVIRNTDSAGAAWTVSSMNAVTTRFTSSDVTPDVYLDGVCIEVAHRIAVAPDAGNAAGTGTANAPSTALTVPAALASGTGAASAAVPAVGGSAENAAGTGTAYDATNAITANAEVATGTGTAYDATVTTGTNATEAPAGLAEGTGVAYDTTTAITANAPVATGTGTAYDAATALTAPAGTATGTGAAYDATAAIAANAPVATGTGVAAAPTPALTVNAEAAAGTGEAYDATVSTSSAVNAPAGLASGTGAAYDATAAITVAPDAATGTGTAHDATITAVSATEPPVSQGGSGPANARAHAMNQARRERLRREDDEILLLV